MRTVVSRVLPVSLVLLITLGGLVQGAGPDLPTLLYLPYVTNASRAPFDLPTLEFSREQYTAAENAGQATIEVRLSEPSQVTVTVDYVTLDGTATAGSDYAATSGRLTFAPGQTIRTFVVPLLDDELVEPDETLSLALTNSDQAFLGARRTAILTIVDDDQELPAVQFSSRNYSAYEGAGAATIVVTLNVPATREVTVYYATSDGTARAAKDYVAAWGMLTFAPGETSQEFVVSLIDDAFAEQDETLDLRLSSPSQAVLGTLHTAVLTIVDDDVPPTVQFSSSSYSVHEGTGEATILVSLSVAAEQTVSVDYATSDGTAIAGSDYTAASGTLTFAPGQISRTFSVTILDDLLAEPDEVLNLTLSNPRHVVLGTPRVAVLTIVDSDETPTVQFSSSGYSVHEGAGEATVVVTLSRAVQNTVTVNYATADGTAAAGSDYAAASGTLTFSPGQTSRTFSVTVYDDSRDEENETVRLTLNNVVGANLGVPAVATLTILDDDEPITVQFGSTGYRVSEGSGAATIVATLSAAADHVVKVNYATADGTATAGSDYVSASGTLTFAAGEVHKTFAVTIMNDSDAEEDETVRIELSNPVQAVLGTPSVAILTIADDDETPSVTVRFASSSYNVNEGGGAATIVVTLSAAAQSTVSVDYATADGTAQAGSDYVATSGTLSFTPGQTSRSFVVTILDDSVDEANETVNLQLSNPVNAVLGAPDTAMLTIVDNDGSGRTYFGVQIGAIHEVTPETVLVSQGGPGLTQLGENLDDVNAAAYSSLVTALRDSGASYARIYLEWDQIDPLAPQPGQPPSYDWNWFDSKLSLIAETDVEMVIIVSDAPPWAAERQCAPFYADRMDEFGRFLTDLVNRYKVPPYNVKYWELLNEPDWNGVGTMAAGGLSCWGNDADRYAEMLAVAYAAIKAADGGATVLMGGLAHENFEAPDNPDWRFVRYFPDQVLQHGGGAHMDALNIHAFPYFDYEWQRWTPENPPTCGIVDDGIGQTYEAWGIDIMAKIAHFRNRMSVCHQVNKPLWVTETGLRATETYERSQIEQARYAIAGNVRAVAAGAEAVIWFALSTRYSQWQHEGLLFDDWRPKPAFYAFQTLTSELDGYTFARNMNQSSPNEAYVFRNQSGQDKTVAWTTGWGTRTLTFNAATRLRVVDRMGQVTFIQDGGAGDQDGSVNGSVRLLLSFDPVFVTVVS